ncbi:MAG: transcription termination factor NusA [Candidatus Moranbacteria bacterium]|nr:transcription termination factor NusA [Candidatus Moranbacteria bacterium]
MAKQSDDSTGINPNEFSSAINQICEEKGIDKDKVIETIEAALAAAYKKDYGKKSQNIKAKFDEVSGQAKFFLVKEVVDETTREFIDPEQEEVEEDEINEKVGKKEVREEEDQEEKLIRFNPERDILLEDAKKDNKKIKLGDEVEMELEAKSDYGRIAAQTAKQVIIQRIREAERNAMFKEYKEKEGEVVNGTIQRVEGRNVFVDIGKSVGVLFPTEQVRGETYNVGQRLKVYIASVEADTRGAGIVLSRSSVDLVKRLFELEVPEIFAGTVEIKAISREAGSRTKIAVSSKETGIDPVGSCVGQKGTRVQAIIDELGGEKIDIVEWNDNIEKFITSAISPAKVISVRIKDEENKGAEVVVPNDQLSLAIGKSGQNVRLAAKLTGWKIDVVGEDVEIENEKKAEKEEIKEEAPKLDEKKSPESEENEEK